MQLRSTFIIILGICTATILHKPLFSQQRSLGIFSGRVNFNHAEAKDSLNYDESIGAYQLTTKAEVNTPVSNSSNFIYNRVTGDFNLYARCLVSLPSSGKDYKMGLMIRSGLDHNASAINATLNADGIVLLETSGATINGLPFTMTNADVLQIERRDSVFTLRVARFGEPFITQQITVSGLGDEVFAGLFVSTENGQPVKGVFKDVRFTIPVDPGLALLRTNIGSTIEILEVETGNRKIATNDSVSLYSPVFCNSGRSIIYGKEGLLYQHDLVAAKTEVIPAGNRKCFNNDHVVSPDEKSLAICIKVLEKGGALLYTVPITGGEPKQINDRGATYPHCWSANGKELLFTRSSDGKYDIYKIAVKGGKETRLTKAEGRDDGPEYSPDGRYIYFNSNRTGTMLLWRMDANGSNENPITDGEFHDWFPHISPDGKWIAFLSYQKDEVSSAANPYYKQVYIRLMPTAGGKPKIIAYLYGGNGTMNSPCWSPDSKTIVFASNTDINL